MNFRKRKTKENVECGLKSVSTGEKERKKDFLMVFSVLSHVLPKMKPKIRK